MNPMHLSGDAAPALLADVRQLIEQARQMIANGELGEIRIVNMQFAHGFAAADTVQRLLGQPGEAVDVADEEAARIGHRRRRPAAAPWRSRAPRGRPAAARASRPSAACSTACPRRSGRCSCCTRSRGRARPRSPRARSRPAPPRRSGRRSRACRSGCAAARRSARAGSGGRPGRGPRRRGGAAGRPCSRRAGPSTSWRRCRGPG